MPKKLKSRDSSHREPFTVPPPHTRDGEFMWILYAKPEPLDWFERENLPIEEQEKRSRKHRNGRWKALNPTRVKCEFCGKTFGGACPEKTYLAHVGPCEDRANIKHEKSNEIWEMKRFEEPYGFDPDDLFFLEL